MENQEQSNQEQIDQDLLFENSQSVYNFGFDDNKSQWNMSTFDQDADAQERHDADGVTVRGSNASTSNYVSASNFESAKANRRNRKQTAAFGGMGERPG